MFALELYPKGPQTAAPASGLPSKSAVVSLLQVFTTGSPGERNLHLQSSTMWPGCVEELLHHHAELPLGKKVCKAASSLRRTIRFPHPECSLLKIYPVPLFPILPAEVLLKSR